MTVLKCIDKMKKAATIHGQKYVDKSIPKIIPADVLL